jgi:DNA-binding MarR family transcriptional regulator
MTETPWTPVDVAQMFLEVMPRFGRLITLNIREAGEDEMTIMQVGVLFQIGHERLTVSDLAKQRKVSLQSMSVQVQALVEKGWVVRIPNPTDRRQHILQVTPEGMQRMMTARNQMTTVLAQVLSDLAPPELAAAQIFLPALERLAKQHMNSNCPPDK